MDEELVAFARTYQRFMESMHRVAGGDARSPIRELVDEHLGADSRQIPVIAETFPAWDHVNVQVAITTLLAEEDGAIGWWGSPASSGTTGRSRT